ncbi:MAG TPA: hypothetical protein VIT00_09000 [Terrimicrobiaceae bacterium]
MSCASGDLSEQKPNTNSLSRFQGPAAILWEQAGDGWPLPEFMLAIGASLGFSLATAAALPHLLMAAKPTMDNWMLHHSEAGVRCVGSIRNHQKFPDGSFVRTSVVVARFPGGIVTENGSSYMLGNKHPQNGVQSQGLYLSLPNAMSAQQENPVPRPIARP